MAEAQIYFNPWDPEFRANPYPHYGALVASPPVMVQVAPIPVALVARYRDVATVLRDPERFSSVQPPPPPGVYQNPFSSPRNVLNADPPDHTRLRRLISRDFTPRRIREMEPRIRGLAAHLLDEAARHGEFDLMADFANVLPVKVIADMLGVPQEMYATFKDWSDRIVASGNNPPGAATTPDQKDAIDALINFFRDETERRRREPGADLVSALVAAHDDAEALSMPEVLSFLALLLIAGNETTTNLIGNGTLALMRNPDQLDLLRKRPELLESAIEEMLRYDGPVQSTARFPKQAAQLGGVEIPAGGILVVVLAAANRDPAQFPAPDRFDITRTPNDHLAFGEGIHFCMGAPLARMEARIAFGEMLSRFPRLRMKDPAGAIEYKGSYFLRGLQTLPLAAD
jgi:cytochrome P450